MGRHFRGIISRLLFVTLAVISVLSVPVFAELTIFACNSTASIKQSFYDNESVYVCGNFTAPSDTAEVYIVSHRTSWTNGTYLLNLSLGYKIIQGNSSGGIPATLIWETPDTGSYDLIADGDKDGVFNTTSDVVDNYTVAGFTVLEAPKPTITAAFGVNHPESHDCDLNVDWDHGPMMQVNLSVSDAEGVRINSLALTAFGSGDEENDVKVVYLIDDINGDGQYDSGDALIAYSNYMRDDGAAFLNVETGFVIEAGRAKPLLITYTMDFTGSVDDTYRFDLITINAIGRSTGESVAVNGLPLGSAIKTIPQEHSEAPSTTVPTPSTIPPILCDSDEDCGGTTCTNKRRTGNRCVFGSEGGSNECIATSVDVDCCSDSDCVKGYYCLNYECAKEKSGGLFGIFGGEGDEGDKNMMWIIISIVIVVAAVVAIFLFIMNKKKKKAPTEGESSGDKEWSLLKKKWEENK